MKYQCTGFEESLYFPATLEGLTHLVLMFTTKDFVETRVGKNQLLFSAKGFNKALKEFEDGQEALSGGL